LAEKLIPIALGLLLLGILANGGCEDSASQQDERLHSANQAAIEAQRQQNQLVAAQSQVLAENSQRITAAADAVLAREHQIRQDLNQQQTRIDTGRADLEKERQLIAQQRHRDPLVAAALQSVGLWLACTTPLLFGFYVLRLMFNQEAEHAELAGFLVSELTSDQPRILPAAAFGPPRIERYASPPPHLPEDAPPDDAPF